MSNAIASTSGHGWSMMPYTGMPVSRITSSGALPFTLTGMSTWLLRTRNGISIGPSAVTMHSPAGGPDGPAHDDVRAAAVVRSAASVPRVTAATLIAFMIRFLSSWPRRCRRRAVHLAIHDIARLDDSRRHSTTAPRLAAGMMLKIRRAFPSPCASIAAWPRWSRRGRRLSANSGRRPLLVVLRTSPRATSAFTVLLVVLLSRRSASATACSGASPIS